MGCFNTKGCFSNMPIVAGDRAVVILGIRNKCGSNEFSPGMVFTPISLPIRGRYNDYGSLKSIDDVPANKIIVDLFGGRNIEDILYMAERAEIGEECDIINKHIKDILQKRYTELKKYGIDVPKDNYKNYEFARVMEHEEVFDSIIKISGLEKKAEQDYLDDVKACAAYAEIIKKVEENFGLKKDSPKEIEEKLKSDISVEDKKLYMSYQIGDLLSECKVKKERNFISFLTTDIYELIAYCYSIYKWQYSDTKFLLYPYKNAELKEEYKKEFVDFACLMRGIMNLNLVWGDSNYYGQDVHYDECIKFAKTILNVMKNKQKNNTDF